jgi:protoporphyrinogen oxidase
MTNASARKSAKPPSGNRRRVLAAGLGLTALGCQPASDGASPLERLGVRSQRHFDGNFVGPDLDRGHLLQSGAPGSQTTGATPATSLTTAPPPSSLTPTSPATSPRRTRVAIIGAGVAGLSAARALQSAGIDDYQVFELDSTAGGNSRHGEIAGLQCPWGAHYLPTPDLKSSSPDVRALLALLRDFGLIKKTAQGEQYAEQALCHAPQERVLVDGRWQSGLLPLEGASVATLGQYERFAEYVRGQQRRRAFSIPTAMPGASIPEEQAALDRSSFAQWLLEHQFDDAQLRWYLDYCCRDDYGADSNEVSAWAGIHYFASRHGFSAPSDSASARDADGATDILTWPQGNSWLTDRLAGSLGERLRLNSLVRSIEYLPQAQTASRPMTSRPAATTSRPGATTDAVPGAISRSTAGPVRLTIWMPLEDRQETWLADFVVLAVPLNIAARLLQPVPGALRTLLPMLKYSAWQVANVHLRELPAELPGAPLSWDNVIYGRDWLGFVDASHQLLQSHRRETVWTSYRALGTSVAARRRLMTQSWREQAQQVLVDLRVAYPRIERAVGRIDVTRWGHAMAVPVPGLRSNGALAGLRDFDARVQLAHSDLAGYSIFEEAFAAGLSAGAAIADKINGKRR